jgi:hypothetical protein
MCVTSCRYLLACSTVPSFRHGLFRRKSFHVSFPSHKKRVSPQKIDALNDWWLCKNYVWYGTALEIKVGLESCRGGFDLGLARVWK